MGRPKSKKATIVKDSIQETPFEVQTERDEQAAAAAKQPSKLSSKAFFGKDVPQPEPKKALVPLNCINGTRGKRAPAEAKAPHHGAATGATTVDVTRGPQPCRAPVDFLVEERVKRTLEQEPDLAYNAEEVRRLRAAMKTQCKDDWAAMSEEEKWAYLEKAKEDKQRFRTEMRAWREANGVASKDDAKVEDDGDGSDDAVVDDDVPAAETAEDIKPAMKGNKRKAAAAPQSKGSKKATVEAHDTAVGAATAPADEGDQPEETAASGGRPKRGGQKKAASVDAAGSKKAANAEKVSRAALRWAEQQRKELLGEDTEAAGDNDVDEGKASNGGKVAGNKAGGRKATAAQGAAPARAAATATQKRATRGRKVIEEDVEDEEMVASESETEDMDKEEDDEMSSSDQEESEEEAYEPVKVAAGKRPGRAAAGGAAAKAQPAAGGAKRGRQAIPKKDGKPVQSDSEPEADDQAEAAKSKRSADAVNRAGTRNANTTAQAETAGKSAAARRKGRAQASAAKLVEAAEPEDEAEPANTKPASKKARVEDAAVVKPELASQGPAADGVSGDKPAVQKRGGRSTAARGAKAPAQVSDPVVAADQAVAGDKKPPATAKPANQGKGKKRAAAAPAVDPAVVADVLVDDAKERSNEDEQQPEPGNKMADKVKVAAPRGRTKKQRKDGDDEQLGTSAATNAAADNDGEASKAGKQQPEPEKKAAAKPKAAAPRGRAKKQGKDEEQNDGEVAEQAAREAAAEVPVSKSADGGNADEQQPGAKASAKPKAAAPRGRGKKQGKVEQQDDAEGEQQVDEEMGNGGLAPVAKTGRGRGGAAAKKVGAGEGTAKGRPRRGSK